MATKITATDHVWAIAGGTERRLAERPNGDLWVIVHTASRRAKFFRSSDQGATWHYSSYSDLDLGQYSTVLSFHIDEDGHAHVAYCRWETSPQLVVYAHGVPSSSGSGFIWKQLTLAPAGGRINLDADVTAFRIGGTRHVWIYWGLLTGHRLSKVSIGSSNTPQVDTTVIDPGNSLAEHPFAALEFAHVGDGVTPKSAPDVFLSTASFRLLPGGGNPDIRVHRGVYQSGTWQWGSHSRVLEQAPMGESTMASVYDGDLLWTAWAPNGAGLQVRVASWNGDGATAPTRVDPPALPSGLGVVNGLSIAHDPTSDDIFLAIHDRTDGDIRWTRYRRAGSAWDAWAILTARTATEHDNKVQLLRHPRLGNVDLVWMQQGSGPNNGVGHLYHDRLVTLSRKPGQPGLRSPASGALADLDRGATFEWSYVPSGPGDTQQAWLFRRRYSTTTEYWNDGSKAWSTTAVFNTGSTESVSFPAGRWPTGTTYSWAVQARSSSGVDSDVSNERTVISTTAPVVEVTGPSGLIYNESTPLVTWDYSGLDAQRDYLVEVLNATTSAVVWTSGTVTSSTARSAQVSEPLDPEIAYVVRVTVTSIAGLAGEPDTAEFSLSLTPPAGPLIGVVDELTYPSDVPVARLNLRARSNYMEPDQAYGQSGWVVNGNATVAAQPADLASMIEESLKMTSAAAGPYSAITAVGEPPEMPEAAAIAAPMGPVDFPVLAGTSYTAVAHFNPVEAARAGRVSLVWYDSDEKTAEGANAGSVISTTEGEQVVLSPGSYLKAFVSATAPDGAKLVRVVVSVLGATVAGEVTYVTRMSVHPGLVAEWQPGGFSQTQTIRVERSDDDGATWKQIIAGAKTDYWQRATAYDRSSPLGREIRYRGYTDVDLGSGARLASEASPIAVVTIDTPGWVLRDSTVEDEAIFAYVVDHQRGDTEQAVTHRPAGREYPVIDSEGPQSAEGSLTLYVPKESIDATVEMLRRPVPLLVQSPDGKIFRARFLSRDYKVEALRHRLITANYFEVL